MNRLLICFFIFLYLQISIFAQEKNDKVNTPNILMQYIDKSPLLYTLEELKDTILPIDRSKNLVDNIFYSLKDGEESIVIQYEDILFNDNLYLEGKKQFEAGNYSEALKDYKKLIEKYPDFTYAYTLQAKCLIKMNKDDDAIDLLRAELDENYIDFEAQELLGELYDKIGLNDIALRYMTTAHILNRNDTNINNKRKQLFQKKGFNTKDWAFTPQVKCEKSNNTVYIYTKQQYQFYAFADALWQFDTDYRATKSDPDKEINLNRLQETILFHSAALQKVPWYADLEEGKCFKLAMNKMMINEFIYYEIILPQHPDEALKLSENQLNKLVNYVLAVRGEQK